MSAATAGHPAANTTHAHARLRAALAAAATLAFLLVFVPAVLLWASASLATTATLLRAF